MKRIHTSELLALNGSESIFTDVSIFILTLSQVNIKVLNKYIIVSLGIVNLQKYIKNLPLVKTIVLK